ncbi:MAG: polymer-forming cytoskeletal protein [Labilithrix sp.]|nr:polymer-forming cytoskeletal protein [Labilithrix sp.]MCW5809677.1 polymer-forming cytoskeletal protein [Labilithrix sp.]
MARARTTSGGEAVIGRSTRVRGRVSGDGDLRLEGTIEGDVTLRGGLTIAGELDGEVRADGVVHLEAGAKVRGDIHGESVAIDEGAEYVGRLDAQFELPPELGGAPARRR